jgi:hypothetical protein
MHGVLAGLDADGVRQTSTFEFRSCCIVFKVCELKIILWQASWYTRDDKAANRIPIGHCVIVNRLEPLSGLTAASRASSLPPGPAVAPCSDPTRAGTKGRSLGLAGDALNHACDATNNGVNSNYLCG